MHEVLHYSPAVIVLLAGGVLLLLSRRAPEQILREVEWETLAFFAGLFVMVGALVKVGTIGDLADAAATAVGASANVVILGLAKRSGHPISFWEFTKYGLIVAVITQLLSMPYLWLRYFVFA